MFIVPMDQNKWTVLYLQQNIDVKVRRFTYLLIRVCLLTAWISNRLISPCFYNTG